MPKKRNSIDEKEILEFVKGNQPVYLGVIIAKFNLSHFYGSKMILGLIKEGKLQHAPEGKKIVMPS
ncbi:MAG: hypothetical protein ACEPOZ_17585 [Marinifilaceae bacterium]